MQQKPVESKPVEQPVAQAEPVAAEETVQQVEEAHPEEESKDGPKEEHNVAQDGQQRGGRGPRGNYRPRGDGERGGRRPYNNNRGPREDADGFIQETGEKKERPFRGRGGGNRGERGRGNFRGQRDSARGGQRPKDEGTTQPATPTERPAEQQ